MYMARGCKKLYFFHLCRMSSTPKYPPIETLQRLKLWCDRQERCQSDVRKKLNTWAYYGDEAESFIVELILANYINESRFAKAYCSGKFRIKSWGRIKIRYSMKQKGISEACIREGLEEIDEEEYLQCLKNLIEKRMKSSNDLSTYPKQAKMANYLRNKGFEVDLIWREIRRVSG